MKFEVICTITKVEAKKAHKLIEKRNALYNLNKIFVDIASNDLQRKCEKDFQKIELMYAEWWEEIINKYKLQEFPLEQLNVDAVNKSIVNISYD